MSGDVDSLTDTDRAILEAFRALTPEEQDRVRDELAAALLEGLVRATAQATGINKRAVRRGWERWLRGER